MRLIFAILSLAVCLAGCGTTRQATTSSGGSSGKTAQTKQTLLDNQTFLISKYSDDPTYGYTEKNPVKVGGISEGPLNERRFLNALSGPNGEKVFYQRLGSCCPFNTPRGFGGQGLLDKYEVYYSGQEKPSVIYINMYDSEELLVPVGFRLASEFAKKSTLPLAEL